MCVDVCACFHDKSYSKCSVMECVVCVRLLLLKLLLPLILLSITVKTGKN